MDPLTKDAAVKAWHNKPSLKKKYMSRVNGHRLADEMRQGIGWENGKGCAVGCTFHKYNHAAGAEEIGFPVQLIQLQDAIFEGLKNGDAQNWPEQFLGAAKVGADLSMVWPKFALWMLRDRKSPVVVAAKSNAAVQKAVRGVAKLYAEWARTGKRPSEASWDAARDAAWADRAAAGYSARAAAWAAAGYAALAAARAAAWAAAGYAALAAARAAAWDAARAAALAAAVAAWWLSARDELLRLMKECK